MSNIKHIPFPPSQAEVFEVTDFQPTLDLDPGETAIRALSDALVDILGAVNQNDFVKARTYVSGAIESLHTLVDHLYD